MPKHPSEIVAGDVFTTDQYPGRVFTATGTAEFVHTVAMDPPVHPYVSVYSVPIEGGTSIRLSDDHPVAVRD